MGFLPYICAGALLGAVYVFPQAAAEAARQGLEVWAGSVVPGLGVGMVLAMYLCSRMQEKRILQIAASVLCGSPGGARLMAAKEKRGREALRDAALAGVMSPMFFLGAVAGWMGDKKGAALVWVCHVLGAFLTAAFIPVNRNKVRKTDERLSFLQCVQQSVNALLTVGFLLMVGAVAAEMMQCAFPFIPEKWAVCLHCMMEVTGGVQALIDREGEHILAFVCGATSFGGISILMQNLLFWKESGIQAWQLMFVQILHGGISFVLCFFMENLLFIG